MAKKKDEVEKDEVVAEEPKDSFAPGAYKENDIGAPGKYVEKDSFGEAKK